MKKGDVFEEKFVVSDKVYEGFILVFQDKNPMHTQDDFARNFGFKERVMHGNILNGFLSYFIGERLPLKNVVIQTEQIQYVLPVYLNESLDFRCEVTDVYDSVRSLEFKFYFQNSLGKKVARGNIQIGILK